MPRKRIGWDLRCLPADGSPGAGIPHAVRELWSACLHESSEQEFEHIAFISGAASLPEGGRRIHLVSSRSTALKQALKEHPLDLLFCPSGTVPFNISVPAIPWIHDLAILDHPEWFPEPWYQRWFTTMLVRRGLLKAPRVFAVSETTKKEIIKWTSLPESRVLVTGQGIELAPSQAPLPIALQDVRYALILGTVEPRKNIRFIQELWSEFTRTASEEIPLVIAGRDGWGEKLTILPDSSIIRITDLSEPLRMTLLRHASVVLVPSFYEGFGRVAAEALTLGVPVITSDGGALPEVVMNFGQCLPCEPDRWLKAIKETIKPGPIRQYWLEQAEKANDAFSWPPIAKRVLANLKEN